MSDNNVYTHLDPESRSGTPTSKNKSMQEDEMLNDISQKVHFVKQTPTEQPPVPQQPIVQESQEPEPKEQEMTLHEYWILQSQKPKYKEWKKQYQKDYYQKNKEHLDEYQKEYNIRPEVIERKKEINRKYMKEYNQRPEAIERRKEYNQRPEAIERRKEYNQRPEVIERRKEYFSRPEVIEQKKEYIIEKRHKQRLALGAISLPKPSHILHTRNTYIYTDKETYDKAVELNKQVLPGRKKTILFRDPTIESEVSKERARKYRKRPEVKERKKEYYSRPEVKKRINEYKKERRKQLRKEQQ